MSNMGHQHKPNNITVNFFNTFSPLPMCVLKYLIFFKKKKKKHKPNNKNQDLRIIKFSIPNP